MTTLLARSPWRHHFTFYATKQVTSRLMIPRSHFSGRRVESLARHRRGRPARERVGSRQDSS